MSDPGKKLSELRVSDLKEELEKRKLETVGAKATLVERLEKALIEEGLDPANHLFITKKVLDCKKLTTEDEIKVKEEPVDEVQDKEIIDKESNKEVENDNENENQNENDNDDSNNDADDTAVEVDQVGTVDDECIMLEEEREMIDIEQNDNIESNNQDNEESINLTIGEDEQEFLHEEGADEKDKTAELNENQKEKSSAKDVKIDRSSNSSKDEKRSGKDDDAVKSKKKDDKSGTDKKDDSEQKSSTKSSQKDDKDKSTNATGSSAIDSGGKAAPPTRNLWVSGLSALTRASDLKTIFSKYGKVIGAKVVTNTRTPGTRCYGYVTMSSSSDASRCIDHLHRTELHGRIISVERTKNEIGSSSSTASKEGMKRKEDIKTSSSKDSIKGGSDEKRKSDGSKKEEGKSKDEKRQSKGDDIEKEKRGDTRDRGDNSSSKARSETSSVRRVRDYDRERIQRQRERERERERIRHREMLSFQKMRQERERQRQREREQREEERRRREIRERQRQEEQRLAEERKKLALERERLERQKAELLRLERERQKLERERLELERLELKRQQMKIIQSRDDTIKRVSKRPTDDRYSDVSDRKRTSGGESRFEAPPPPRFDASLVTPRSYEKKRDDYTSSSSKRGNLDDYTSSSKRMDYSKRDDFSSSTKRSAIDDYSSIPTKRGSDYLSSSKRGGLDDYSSSKRDGTRDDYKREVEIRHIPPSSGSNSGSFHSNRDVGQSMHKSTSNRYGDSDRSSGNYRRSGMDDMRSSSNVNKRYDSTSGYSSNSTSTNGVWASSSNHMGHTTSGSGAPQLKSYVSNGISSNMHNTSNWQKTAPVDDSGWRQMTSNQDRYDRTYNERSSGYPNATGGGGGMYASNGRSGPDRYGNAGSSRY